MPITTQTISKGIPLRLCEPKHKGKPCTQNNTTANANAKEPGSCKRSTWDNNSDNEDDVSTSDDSTSWAKKRYGKRHHTNPGVEFEVEVVDEDVEPPKKYVEDVESIDSVGGQELPNKQDVSTSHISWTLETHHTLG